MTAALIFQNFIGKIFLQRHLIWNFVLRDLKVRYVGSFMGFFWSVVHPLVLLVSYTFVFSVVFKIKPASSGVDSFALFLFCGILPWLYFQDTVVRSCESVVSNANLIRRTVFPSEILPLSIAFSNLVTHLIGFAILLAVLLLNGMIYPTLAFIPVYLFLLFLLSLGLGWIFAALQVFLRDTAQVLNVMLVFWFWFTPIFYETDRVPHWIRVWIEINPLSYVVEGFRLLLLEGRLPSAQSLLVLVAWGTGAFVVGGIVFRNTKREFADVL